MLFENQAIWITGGGSGIGRAAALAFAREGASLLITDVNDAGGEETVAMITQEGGRSLYRHADVTNADDVSHMARLIVDQYGGLHATVNSAGISGTFDKALHETDEDNYTRVMDVNVKGVWLCMRAQIPVLIQSGGGSIVNLASVAGLIGSPGGSIYSASKHAVIGLTKAAALEYARVNVRVNAVCPSFIETPMVTSITEVSQKMAERTVKGNPMKRLGQANEVAELIVWLASSKSSFVNGAAYAIDGGLTAG
jgi:NAD(P)-dependent dehydrogenase (short-subunit alcohol dehydrogenase family)